MNEREALKPFPVPWTLVFLIYQRQNLALKPGVTIQTCVCFITLLNWKLSLNCCCCSSWSAEIVPRCICVMSFHVLLVFYSWATIGGYVREELSAVQIIQLHTYQRVPLIPVTIRVNVFVDIQVCVCRGSSYVSVIQLKETVLNNSLFRSTVKQQSLDRG